MQMVVRATASKLSSSSDVAPAERRSDDRRARRTRVMMEMVGRRGLLLSTVVAASQVNDSKTELLQRYLKKSQDNKDKNDKERLDSYYKRNYKDYFEFVEGSLEGKKDKLSESEKGILDWLQKNK